MLPRTSPIILLISLLFTSLTVGVNLSHQQLMSSISLTPFNENQCHMCRFIVSLVNHALRSQSGADLVYTITNNFCSYTRIESPLVCSKITKLFNQEVTKVLSRAVFTPDQLCGLLSNNTCGKAKNPLADWQVQLELTNNIDQDELERLRQSRLLDSTINSQNISRKPFRIIHLSDTHVDLNYMEGSPGQCKEPLCCRNSSTPIGNSYLKAGYWATQSNCDIPLRTFQLALDFIKTTMKESKDIEYIIWTGDIQPHDVWEQSKESASATYEAVFEQIYASLPSNVKIFPTLGNHEMVPVDSFSPSNLLSVAREDSPEWLYKKIDSYWSRWLPSETMATITRDGFYATSIRPGLKLISLNTNYCHNKNFWLYINSEDPGNQLQWLIHELQISELLHEQVHIIGHIPPGSEDCLKVWSRNFNKIIRRFSKTVSSQFYGHTHRDEFEIFYDQEELVQQTEASTNNVAQSSPTGSSSSLIQSADNWSPISVGFIGPSVSTFIGLNPSMRIYTVDPARAYTVSDFETYSLDLNDASDKGGQVENLTWKSSGSFAEMFTLKDTSAESLHTLLVDIAVELDRYRDDFQFPSIDSIDKIIYALDYYRTRSKKVRESKIIELADSKLFKLYRHSNTNSDSFSENEFLSMSSEEKARFLCQYFTSQSHNLNSCSNFIGDESINFSSIDLIP